MRKLLALVPLLLPLHACAPPVDAPQAAASITEGDFYGKTEIIAHTHMPGHCSSDFFQLLSDIGRIAIN